MFALGKTNFLVQIFFSLMSCCTWIGNLSNNGLLNCSHFRLSWHFFICLLTLCALWHFPKSNYSFNALILWLVFLSLCLLPLPLSVSPSPSPPDLSLYFCQFFLHLFSPGWTKRMGTGHGARWVPWSPQMCSICSWTFANWHSSQLLAPRAAMPAALVTNSPASTA